MSSNKIAIIAAMDREVRPLVRGAGWRTSTLVKTVYSSFENESALVVCAGIGGDRARTAAENVIAAIHPRLIVSVGLAGGLTPELKTGQIFVPVSVMSSSGGFRLNLSHGAGDGVLVSASGITGPEAKRMLARQHGAQAADMEAAPVAEVAQAHGIPFVAVKAICDEYDFPMPDLEPFITAEGKLQTARFVLYAALHPALWATVGRLGSNSRRAIQKLCRALEHMLANGILDYPKIAAELAVHHKETSG